MTMSGLWITQEQGDSSVQELVNTGCDSGTKRSIWIPS